MRDWTWLKELPRSPSRGLARLRDDGKPFDGLVWIALGGLSWAAALGVSWGRLTLSAVPAEGAGGPGVATWVWAFALGFGASALAAVLGIAGLVLPTTTFVGRALAGGSGRPPFQEDYIDVLTLFGVALGLPGIAGGAVLTVLAFVLPPGLLTWLGVAAASGLAAAWLATLASREVFGLSLVLALVVVIAAGAAAVVGVVVGVFVSPFGFSPLAAIAAIYFLRGPVGDVFRSKERRQRTARRLGSQVLNPHDAKARVELGDLALQKGRPKEAEALAREALDIEPGYLAARYLLGRAVLADGRADEAAAELEAVSSADPKHARGEVQRELGKALLEAGRADEARGALEVFTKANASDSQARYHLGRALRELGDLQGARAALEEAVHLGASVPDFKKRENRPWAEKARAMLKGMSR